MAVFQLVILKGQPFQGVEEEFTNVYHLETSFGETFDDEAAIDSIVALERAVHGEMVRFISAVTYEGVGGNLTPRFRKFLNFQGLVPAGQGDIYRECAIRIGQELPRAGLFGLGRRRFLSKWLHVGCLNPSPGPIAQGVREGSAPIANATAEFYRSAYWRPLRDEEHGGGRLSAPNGDYPLEDSTAFVDPYVEHRQYHR